MERVMKETALEILEQNILAALERAGLKRANAADRLGVDRAWFYRMLSSGKWKMEVLVALADLLHVPLWRLFFDGSGVENLAADMLVLPGAERPALVNLNDYMEVPIVKLQVEMDIVGAGVAQESLGTMFVKKELVGEFSAGKTPYAIELRVKVKA
jgi:hypothetical protein